MLAILQPPRRGRGGGTQPRAETVGARPGLAAEGRAASRAALEREATLRALRAAGVATLRHCAGITRSRGT